MANVLLVEDSTTQAVALRQLLEEHSHTVHHVSNGQLALTALSEMPMDVVVTDMNMPEMNGLQLVETMRADYPHVPAILVTAKGSEDLAAEALQKGASGYVPKTHLNTLLNDTILDVLGVMRADASFSKLISTLRRNVFEFEMPTDGELISPLVSLLMQVISGMELIGGVDMNRLGVAIEHAVANAMYRGNLDLGPKETPSNHAIIYEDETNDLIEQRKSESPYKDRKVFVVADARKDEIRITVRDEGNGFDHSSLPASVDSTSLTEETGKGLVLMKSFADDLIFNETGNEVTIVKRCC